MIGFENKAREKFLLLKLIEECAEVSQRCSKQIQFGKTEVQTGQPLSNGERLKNELLDLEGIVFLLQEQYSIPVWSYDEFVSAKNAKREKLRKYLKLSEELGELPEITL